MDNNTRDKYIVDTHAVITQIAEQVGRHDKTLYGNGQPGICKRLQVMETTMSVKGRLYTALYTAFVACTGGVSGVVVAKIFFKQ